VAEAARVLGTLRELEVADGQKASLLGELDRLALEVEAVRNAASRLEEFEASLPAAREAAMDELSSSHLHVIRGSVEVSEAEDALGRATKERRREAELFAVRARDRLAVARRRHAQARAACDRLDAEAQAAESEARKVGQKAGALARELRGRARLARDAGSKPGKSWGEIKQWCEGARAALFVARGQLAAERDALIRQANELGTAALGEPLGAASTSAVVRRVEDAIH